jgi:hypothetical protein
MERTRRSLGNSPSVLVENEMPPLSELKEQDWQWQSGGTVENHLKKKQLSS